MEPVEFVIRAGRPDTIDTLREYTIRRLSFAVRRFERQIHRLTVRISDLNGPRGGVDSRCSMTADLNNGRRIFVNATTAWPFASVTQVASRLSEALRREVGRTTTRRREAVYARRRRNGVAGGDRAGATRKVDGVDVGLSVPVNRRALAT